MITIQQAQRDKLFFDKFIDENTGLVWSILKKSFAFSLYTGESDDYFQVGCIGLVKAVKRFDISKDVQFSTYAIPMIMGEMKRYRRDFGTSILKVPRSNLESYLKISALKNKGCEESEICKTLGISEKKYGECANGFDCYSFDMPLVNDDESKTLENVISSNVDISEQVAQNDLLKSKLIDLQYRLTEREYKTFLYYLNGKTQTEIAPLIGVSQCQISRILIKVIKICKEEGDIKMKITKDQLFDECKVLGTGSDAVKSIAKKYGVTTTAVYMSITKHDIKAKLLSALAAETQLSETSKAHQEEPERTEPEQDVLVKNENQTVPSLLTPTVFAGKEFKYELGPEIKIFNNGGIISCGDLTRFIQELQEIERLCHA